MPPSTTARAQGQTPHLRVLAITSLFPNAALPHSSSFNRQQLAALRELCQLEVWAPIPWFPFAPSIAPTSPAGRASSVPARDVVGALTVHHPRTLQLPIVGRPIAGPLYAASLIAKLRRRRDDFDVVLGTWAYPDGWAALALSQALGLPAVIKVHGSDINVVAQKPAQRLQLRALMPRAAGVIAVSRPLAERVAELGVERSRLHWIPNGVDRARFTPRDRSVARSELGLGEDIDGEVVIYIGNLKREKGVLDLLDAWPQVRIARPNARLFIVGAGPDAAEVKTASGSQESVTLIGAVPHEQVATWMAACDVLCLPSWNEGMPNVVVEAHASGRAVVGTSVGGIPDLITERALGLVVPKQDPPQLAEALVESLETPVAADDVVAAARSISWAESAAQVFDVLARASKKPWT